MSRCLPWIFGLTLALNAALLFSIEPMIARALLPRFGGAPTVWTIALLFFQVMLLLGYVISHVLASRITPRIQAAFVALLWMASWCFLPKAPTGLTGTEITSPTWALVTTLSSSIGVPFLALALTAPLLQRWYAASDGPSADDPYFLYAASNAGSLLALLAYPLWLEGRFSLRNQFFGWKQGFSAALILMFALAAARLIQDRGQGERSAQGAQLKSCHYSELMTWFILSLVPSSLLLGVTSYLTSDIAAIPLLWAIPMALYLGSFVVAFSRFRRWFQCPAERALPFLALVQIAVMAAGFAQPFLILLHLATFTASCLFAHGELARRRPGVESLTTYFLIVAIGGAAGGALNALIAPLVFPRNFEYPLMLVASCAVLALRKPAPPRRSWNLQMLVLPTVIVPTAALLCLNPLGLGESVFGVLLTVIVCGLSALVVASHRARPIRFALIMGCLFAASGLASGVNGKILTRERNFFGTLAVTSADATDPPGFYKVHRLFHGNTLHGQQSLDPKMRHEPLTYYDKTGPMGQIFEAFDAREGSGSARIGVTGVGAGSLACYARPGQSWTFYEIDPAVVRAARDPKFFTYLSDCQASSLNVAVGDARLSLTQADDHAFDMLILDAFSSDSVPTHLLTREALSLYKSKIKPGGLIALNVTNRYVDLIPVVARLAEAENLVARVRVDARLTPEQMERGKQGSIWAILAIRASSLNGIGRDPRWLTPRASPGSLIWTDDHISIIEHLRIFAGNMRSAPP